MPFYQNILHGHGFRIKWDDGVVYVGFFTGRKVYAADACQAERRLRERFLREKKVVHMIEQAREAGCEPKVETHDLFPISLRHFLFGKYPKGFILYPDDEGNSG
jgi:hypothetical protein